MFPWKFEGPLFLSGREMLEEEEVPWHRAQSCPRPAATPAPHRLRAAMPDPGHAAGPSDRVHAHLREIMGRSSLICNRAVSWASQWLRLPPPHPTLSDPVGLSVSTKLPRDQESGAGLVRWGARCGTHKLEIRAGGPLSPFPPADFCLLLALSPSLRAVLPSPLGPPLPLPPTSLFGRKQDPLA